MQLSDIENCNCGDGNFAIEILGCLLWVHQQYIAKNSLLFISQGSFSQVILRPLLIKFKVGKFTANMFTIK
jgi:hypothetical protein